jgi:autotransporter strand-loop-strand O-heptosyltransferase
MNAMTSMATVTISGVGKPQIASSTPPAPVPPSTEAGSTALPAPAPGSPPVKFSYPQPASILTQHGERGVRFDFNLGARVALPAGEYTLRITDLDTCNIVFETKGGNATVGTRKKHFVRYRIEVKDGETNLLSHDYDCRGKEVLIAIPVGTIGDSVGWLPYAIRFKEAHGCNLTVAMSGLLIPLFKDSYPDVTFLTHEEVNSSELRERLYATYYVGLFFGDEDNSWQPSDFRHVGLHRTAGHILGVDPTEFAPAVALPDESRPIDEPYVVIAVQASSMCKMWTNPYGWREVIASLKKRGYRVICIDKQAVYGTGLSWNHLPHGCEDETGDRPLVERARWLKHAEFFVGLSSGLSWLAWAMQIPVVMISGFTHPTNEFDTPYRVFNTHVCNSCWHDIRHRFDNGDYYYCPRHKNTPRQFECTRMITAGHVLRMIDAIPDVRLEPKAAQG